MISRRLFPCVAFALFHSAAQAVVSITIAAGDFQRRDCPVVFSLSDKPSGTYSLVGPDEERVPLQVDGFGRASFIEPHLAKGSSKTYRIEASSAAATQVSATRNGSMLNVAFGKQPILAYQMEAGPVPTGVSESFMHGAHLHPVFSPSGRLVTGNHPADHRWHRGIWFAWTKTDFQGRAPDFWNMGKDKDGRFSGEVRFDRLERTWSGPVEAGFRGYHRFVDHTSGTEKDVLREAWDVTVFRPLSSPPAAFVFDLVSSQVCAGNVPLKLPKYHYGGLGVRGAAEWDPRDKVRMLTSNGHDRKAGDGQKAKWVHLGGKIDGAPSGLAVLIHPDNFRFPQPLRLNPSNPQLSVAPSADGDWEIKPGSQYVSKYRVVVADGEADPATLDRLWADYATPPSIEVR